MKINIIAIASLSTILSNGAVAGTMGPETEADSCWSTAGACWGTPKPEPFPMRKVISLNIGPAWSGNGTTQTILLQPTIQNTYSTTNPNHLLASGELVLGMQKQLNATFYSQFGIALAAAGRAKFTGDVWENANPNLNDYTYKYNVTHGHVAVKGKLLADVGYGVRPYVSASIGIGVNKASDFSMSPKIYKEVIPPAFESHSTMTTPYTLGIGVQEVVNDNLQAGFGYEFVDWGKSELGRAPGQSLNTGLIENHIYTNVLLVTLTYIM